MHEKVLFVVNDTRYFVTHRLTLAIGVKRAGYEVHVAGPSRQYEHAMEKVSSSGIPFHVVPIERQGLNPIREAYTFFRLVLLYKRLRPHIVHHITVKPVIYGSIAARIADVPATVNAVAGLGRLFRTGSGLQRVRAAGMRWVYRHIMSRKDVSAIFQNTEDRAAFIESGIIESESTILVPGSGTDLDRFEPNAEPDEPPIVAFVGRLLQQKGLREFIQAASILKKEGLAARFVLVGDAADNRDAVPEHELLSAAKAGTIEIWGWTNDIPAQLRRCAVVCLPSYHEGLPKALIDAAAAGRPVVATNIAGCRAVVEHQVSGLLVPPRDPVALADALRLLLSNAARRREMGVAARAIAESRFDVEKVVEAHIAFYKAIDTRISSSLSS